MILLFQLMMAGIFKLKKVNFMNINTSLMLLLQVMVVAKFKPIENSKNINNITLAIDHVWQFQLKKVNFVNVNTHPLGNKLGKCWNVHIFEIVLPICHQYISPYQSSQVVYILNCWLFWFWRWPLPPLLDSFHFIWHLFMAPPIKCCFMIRW